MASKWRLQNCTVQVSEYAPPFSDPETSPSPSLLFGSAPPSVFVRLKGLSVCLLGFRHSLTTLPLPNIAHIRDIVGDVPAAAANLVVNGTVEVVGARLDLLLPVSVCLRLGFAISLLPLFLSPGDMLIGAPLCFSGHDFECNE